MGFMVLRIAVVALAYYTGGKIGLIMPYMGSSITLLWPPTGIALAALLAWGLWCWPGVFLGALLVNLTTSGLSIPVALSIAVGNTLGPVLGALILKRLARPENLFKRSRDVIAFILIASGTMLLTATAGTLSLYAGGKLLRDLIPQAWLGWWLGDTVGVLIFAPPLLVWSAYKIGSILRPRFNLELILVMSACIGLAWLVFSDVLALGQLKLSLAFLVFLPLIWAGLRFETVGASIAALVISILAVWGTAQGNGPFARGHLQIDQLVLCIFVATTALVSYTIIGVQASRRYAEQHLRDSEYRLRLALKAVNQGLYDLNVQTGKAKVSPEYALMLGYDPETFEETNQKWQDRLHPDDREHVSRIYEDYIAGTRDDYDVEFRQLTRQGDWKWILSLGKVVEWDCQGRPLRMLGTHADINDRKAKEIALQKSEDALHRAQTLAKLGSWHFDLVNNELTWSKETYRIFGVENVDPLSYGGFLACVVPEDRELVDRAWKAALQGEVYDIEHRINVHGHIKWLREQAQVSFDAAGNVIEALGTAQDISERKHAEEDLSRVMEELRLSEQHQREQRTLAEHEQSRMVALLSAMNIGILFEDNERLVEYVNPAFLRMWLINERDDLLGVATKLVLERSTELFARPAHTSKNAFNMPHSHEISERMELELSDGRMLTQLSYPVNDIEGRTLGRLWIYEDITQERHTAQQLLYLAERDPLTGLYNRHRFQEQLENLIASCLRSRGKFALLYFDLDDFKYINDTFGHSAGDTVLVRAAGEISSIIRQIEIFARLGGDEFAILSIIQPGEDINALPARIVNAISSIPLRFRGTNIRLTSSVGVAVFPEHGETAEDLVAHADTAMYQAKNQGKNTWAVYDSKRDSSEAMMHRMTWHNMIAQALEEDLFDLYFQGVYTTASNTLTHAEVLIRMRDPNQPEQLIMPGQFIPIAEKNGQILDIDRWVVRKTIELLANDVNMPPLAINISGRSFDEPSLPQYIRKLLMELNVEPSRLIIELTETAAVSDIKDAQRFIEAIHQSGCKVCLDDFGSGFSTFGYLKYLGVEILKIDGSFISDLPNNRDNQIFVKAMVEVARGLGKITVAEFVEDEATFNMIRNLGIDLAQGYYLGRPKLEIPIN